MAFLLPPCRYFIKSSPLTGLSDGKLDALSPATIHKHLQFGVLRGNKMDSLCRIMNGVFVQRFIDALPHHISTALFCRSPYAHLFAVVARRTIEPPSWPESVKKDLKTHCFKFMSSLTEAVNQSKGKTVLYIPPERRITESSKAALDKDLVQRLESTVIQWTRQIKEVVNNQDNNHNEDGVGN